MKRILLLLSAVLIIIGISGNASATFLIDFEDGTNGAAINDISGVSFQDFNAYDSIYGDSRVGYNTTSDDLGYGSGSYHHNGNMWLWAGTNADAQGVIVDFTQNDGTWFSTGYSSASTFYVEAWLTDGSMVSTSGAANTGSTMGSLTVNATSGLFIDYIVLHDTGNHWIVDDMRGDTSGIDPVPEPATMLLFGLGLLGLAGVNRKKQ